MSHDISDKNASEMLSINNLSAGNLSTDNLSRRNFLKSSGLAVGAFVIGMQVPGLALAEEEKNFTYNLFVAIDAEGIVTITAMSPDIGQGARTSMPSIVADELEADWDRVKLVQAGPDKRLGSQSVGGSSAIRDNYANLRLMGATARTMLERAAARIWAAYASDCKAELHEVVHTPTGRRIGYGELAAVASKLPVPNAAEVNLKSPKDFRYIGKSLKHVDQHDILHGTAVYSMDLKMPGMKVAMMKRSPVVGGSVKSYDDSAALKIKGVEKVVAIGDGKLPIGFGTVGGLAVVARNTWAAKKGCEALEITWNKGVNADYDSVQSRKDMEQRVAGAGKVERDRGDVKTAFAEAEKIIESAFYVPHHSHAQMEPPVALADFKDDKLTIWTPTQNPQTSEQALAGALQIKPENITLHVPLTGGGFGRKGKPDFAIEAALISRAVGEPVKLVWSREDDMQHGYYHSSAAQRLKASLDKKGRVTGWYHHTTFPSISETFSTEVNQPSPNEVGQGVSNLPYDIDNIRAESSYSPAQVRIGWSRAVHNINHAFAIGSFVDELAHAADKDPGKFLLKLIGKARIVNLPQDKVTNFGYERLLGTHPIDTGRLAAVVKKVIKTSGWGKRLPKGHARGIAVHRSFLTYVATVTEVKIDEDGSLTIPHIYHAVDCGQVVNVDRVKAQFEGGACYALSHALSGQITAKDGAIEQSNYHDFEVLRLDMVPEVHVHLMDSDLPPTGVGEPTVPTIAPSLCNAIFAATGKRIREMPILPRLEEA